MKHCFCSSAPGLSWCHSEALDRSRQKELSILGKISLLDPYSEAFGSWSDHGRIILESSLSFDIGRSLVSEKESGSCYSDDRVQKHGKQEFEEI